MAVKKTSSSTKGKDAAAPKKKKAAKVKSAKKETAPKKTGAVKKAKAASKKAAPKKSAPKLSPAQADLLKRVHGAGDAGYLGDKKAEHRSLEALRGHKLIKRGAKDKASGHYCYSVSNAGKKHLGTPTAAPAGGSTPAPTAGGAATTPVTPPTPGGTP
jgi:hypothetical protein